MTLVRTSALNGLAVVVRVLTAMLINKILAVQVGPAGYALIGQFQSFVTMVTTVASGAIGTGVTKYTAEYDGDPTRRSVVWRTAALMSLAGAASFALVVAAAGRPLAGWLLHDEAYASVFMWLAASLVLIVANGLLLAVLTGLKAVGALVAASIGGSLAGAAIAVALVLRLGLYGALVAQAVSQAIALFITAAVFRRASRVGWRAFAGRIDKDMAKRLGGFAMMSLTSAILVPLSQIAIRDGLTAHAGLQATGLWQAMWRISELHLMLLTNTLVAYFLPRFSEVTDDTQLGREVRRAYQFVLPLVLLSSSLVFALRSSLVPALLSPAFVPINAALGWQLLGDVLKIGSWVCAFVLISRARTRVYIALEVIFIVLLAAAIVSGGALDGLRGAAIGYAATYALYWFAVHLACARHFRKAPSTAQAQAEAA